jgi:putative transposase
MDERLKFIARLLDGDTMSELCREFGVSRKTGYKILNRYNTCGLQGLTDRSRRPYRQANQLPVQIETLIVRLKQDKPSWGAQSATSPQHGPTRACRNSTIRCTTRPSP